MTEAQSRKRDSTATKAALLDAAASLFAERGFDRTTVRDIAKQAGVNQALLFRYFGTKEALFEEVIARTGRARASTRWRSTSARPATTTPPRRSATSSAPSTPTHWRPSPTRPTPHSAPTSRSPG